MTAGTIPHQHSVNEFISTIKPPTGQIKGIEVRDRTGLRITRK
jgi:hypothetical protein